MENTLENKSSILEGKETLTLSGETDESGDEHEVFERNAVKEAEAQQSEHTTSDFEIEEEIPENIEIEEIVEDEDE